MKIILTNIILIIAINKNKKIQFGGFVNDNCNCHDVCKTWE
jgi:hypothetical protein